MDNAAQMQDYISQAITVGVPLALNVLKVLFIFIVGRWIGARLSGVAVAAMKKGKVDHTIAVFGGNAVRYLILAVTILAVLNVFGFETTSLVAVLGAAGFAVGLAMQGTLSNFAAGVMLLLFRPFSVGDLIDAGGNTGRVMKLEIFATVLANPRGDLITVPNGQIYGAVIKNMTPTGAKVRVDVPLGVAYSADIDSTQALLLEMARNVQDVMVEEGVDVPLTGLNASSIDFEVRVWTHPDNYWGVRSAVLRDAKYALDQAGVGIPYQTFDVNITSTPTGGPALG